MEEYRWEEFLQRLSKRGEPADFKAYMAEYATYPSIDPETWAAMYPMIAADDVARTMLAAALQLPATEAEHTLEQIAGVLPRADLKKRLRKELSNQQRKQHQQVVRVIRHTVIPGIPGLVATFRAYIRGDYDLEQDPNALIREANRLIDQDQDRALELVGQAGVLALRGKELWDRWSEDTDHPLSDWMLVINTFVDRLRHKPDIFPLDAIEHEQLRWSDTLRVLEEKPEREPKEEGKAGTFDMAYAGSLFDDLAPFLYGEKLPTAKALADLPEPPEEYVDLLIHSVREWDKWDFSEPGTEDLLTNMITILGEFCAQEAVDPCIDIVARTIDSELFGMAEAASNALGMIGEPALERVLNFVRYSDNDPARVELADPLARMGRGDPRTYATLEGLFEEVAWVIDEWGTGKADVAYALGLLGDQRAVGLLEATLNDPAADDDARELIETALEALRAKPG